MSLWTDFVKEFAAKNNLTYKQAMSDPRCSALYKEAKAGADKKEAKAKELYLKYAPIVNAPPEPEPEPEEPDEEEMLAALEEAKPKPKKKYKWYFKVDNYREAQKWFRSNYNGATNEIRGPTAPNRNLYDEADWNSTTDAGNIHSPSSPLLKLAKYLEREGVGQIIEAKGETPVAKATAKQPKMWVFKPTKDNYGSTEVERRFMLNIFPRNRAIAIEGLYKNSQAEDFTVGDFKDAIDKTKKPETSPLLKIAKVLQRGEFGKIVYSK